MNTIIQTNGDILTGKLWRSQHAHFTSLPFYTNIPRMDAMAGPLQAAISQGSGDQSFSALLVKLGQGLDNVHPFSYTEAVENLIRDAIKIFSADSSSVSGKNAVRIWAFISRFVMLDRFAQTLGVGQVHPGMTIPKKLSLGDYFGGATKLLEEINPPTKILGKFLKTWRERDTSQMQCSREGAVSASNEGREDAPGVALRLSRRLIGIWKVQKLLNLEAGLEMMALGLTICSENSGVFPESPSELEIVLRRIWMDRLEQHQFEEILSEMQSLQKSIKNMAEYVFAISPLLALSTNSSDWSRAISGLYLLRLFRALGNNRPQILIRVEDHILHAIIGISEGRSRGEVMDHLCSQIATLEKDLACDGDALTWFNAASISSSQAPSSISSSQVPSEVPATRIIFTKTGGLASPPESPHVPLRPSSSRFAVPVERLSPHPANAVDPHETHKTDQLTEQRVPRRYDLVPTSNLAPRSRRSSTSSLLTELSEMEVDGQPMDGIQSAKDAEREEDDSDAEKEEDDSDADMEVDGPAGGVQSESDDVENQEDSNEVEDGDEATMEPEVLTKATQPSADTALANQLASVALRRSTRKKPSPEVVSQSPQCVTPVPLPKVVVMSKPVVRKVRLIVSESLVHDALPKLSELPLAKFHPTMYAEIAGWGSSLKAGQKPHRHVPVQIVRPGRVASTGDDTDTLRIVEAQIQAGFQDGVPPHLLPSAGSMTYIAGSDQSRIFTSSHSEFSRLEAADVQGILRERLILVHGHPLDHNYGWDLPSLGRVYDVEKKITVLVSSLVNPHKPELRHQQGTLREFHRMANPESQEQFSPLNALSLPAQHRNLTLPCQFGNLASHEVAQSRVPSGYESTFDVPSLRSKLEWALVGGKGAISPFHIDSDGLCTVVVVLEGSKYWIVATRMGDQDRISSVDSLGPDWSPYRINDEENVDHFRFEAVHLQKGDMLIMPPGVLHLVLSTSNAICVGRHFYASSTIRDSILGVVHAFLLSGSLTNEDHLPTRTLLYQLLVFWCMRIDKRDVDGAHIPQLSSEAGFLDIVYLGVFVILSPAFDRRFYSNPPPSLVDEVAYATRKFHSLIHHFSVRFVILLRGTPVAASYVVDRILVEFAAAAVVFARGVNRPLGEGNETGGVRITFPRFLKKIETILEDSSPDIMAFFYSRATAHRNFLWTGPSLQIIPRTKHVLDIVEASANGEIVDWPGCPIYQEEPDDSSADPRPAVHKRNHSEDGMGAAEEPLNKRKR